MSVTQLQSVTKLAQKTNSKIIISGDTRRFQGGQHVGAFKAMSRVIEPVKITTIDKDLDHYQRQLIKGIDKDKEQNRNEFPEITVKELDLLHQQGKLEIAKSYDEAVNQTVEKWKEYSRVPVEKRGIIVDTRKEAKAVNQRVQKERIEAGEIKSKMVTIGDTKVTSGDLVRFEKTLSLYNVVAGQTGIIKRIDKYTKVAPVKLDNGKSTMVNFRDYKNITLGYALTPQMARNKKFDAACILTTGKGKQASVTQLNRANANTTIHTWANEDDIKELDNGEKVINTRRVIAKLGHKLTFENDHKLAVELEKKSLQKEENKQVQHLSAQR